MQSATDKLWISKGKNYYEYMQNKSNRTKLRYWMQEQQLKKVLRKIKGVESILEIGCGYGRITKILKQTFPQAQITAIDISIHQLRQARKVLKEIRFNEMSLFHLPLIPTYDLVIAIEVLMHIHPDKIAEAINILTQKSNQYILNLDWYDPHRAGESDFCYKHSYNQLYRENRICQVYTYDLNAPFIGTNQRIFKARKWLNHGSEAQ